MARPSRDPAARPGGVGEASSDVVDEDGELDRLAVQGQAAGLGQRQGAQVVDEAARATASRSSDGAQVLGVAGWTPSIIASAGRGSR